MPSRITMFPNFSSTKNTTVNGRVGYSDKRRLTQGPLIKAAISSKILHPLDEPSRSSQQKLMFEKYNQKNNIDNYNMDAPKGSPLMPRNTDFEITFWKDFKTKFNEIKQDNLKSPISKLNEIMSLKKQVVKYSLVSITGHAHMSVFRFVAVNDGIHAYGEGWTKKEAKKKAAIAFLDKLDDYYGNNTITSTTSDILPGNGSLLKYSKKNALDKIKNLPQQSISKARDYVYLTPGKLIQDIMESKDLDCINNLKSLEIFLNRLKLSQNPSLNKLRNTDFTAEIRKNATELLNAIGEEEHVGVAYLLMSNKSNDIGMVVQLAVTPVLLFVGFGKTFQDAKEMAANFALSYIKLLLQ